MQQYKITFGTPIHVQLMNDNGSLDGTPLPFNPVTIYQFLTDDGYTATYRYQFERHIKQESRKFRAIHFTKRNKYDLCFLIAEFLKYRYYGS
jgi:hypothetical protein